MEHPFFEPEEKAIEARWCVFLRLFGGSLRGSHQFGQAALQTRNAREWNLEAMPCREGHPVSSDVMDPQFNR